MKRSSAFFALVVAASAAIGLASLPALAQQQPAPRPLPRMHASPPPAPPSRAPAAAHEAANAVKPGASEKGAAESSGAAEAEAEEEAHAPKPINWVDISNKEQPPWVFMALNVLILFGLYWKFGKGAISEGLKGRRTKVAREIEEAQRMQKEAEARAAKYQAKLSHLEAELKEMRDSLQAAGEAERDRLVREAEEKAARMERDASFLVEQELKTLRAELTREAVETAVAAAEELLRKRITSSDQERLAEDYLAQLAAKRPSAQERASLPPAAHEGGE